VNILVTGAAGFLGSHLCRALAESGHAARVVGLDARRSCLFDRIGPRVTLAIGDVRSPAVVEAALRDVDLVFHLAAIADPRACAHDAELARAVNVGATAVVVRAAAGRRLVFLSSATVYAGGDLAALAEDAPLGGPGVYAETKLAGERLCREAAERGMLEAVIVRNFNTYGAGQTDAYLVPELVGRGLREQRVQVMSCRSVRDFTYVDDAVAALVALGVSGVPGGVFNLGSGEGQSVGDVACEIARQLDVPSSCRHAPSSGSARLVACNAKLRAAVGWRPAVTLSEGVARTIAWHRQAAREAPWSPALDGDADTA
jgi:nucleoside-diphosphate-sugar epimerase